MRNFKDLIKDNPIALVGLVAALANVVMTMGIEVSAETLGGINILISAIFVFCRWLVYAPSTVDSMVNGATNLAHIQFRAWLEEEASKAIPTPRKRVAKKT